MEESKKIEKDLDELENNVSLLKRDYDSFFSGATKQPPNDFRKKVETTIRHFSSAQGLSYAQRFRYNSLVARFNSFQDLWTKQMKIKEEGRTPSGGLVTNSQAKIVTQKLDAEQLKLQRLFNEYLNTREKTGEGKPNLNFNSFCELLKKQHDQIVSKYQCKDVDFFVKVEDGHAKLKARPV